MVLRRRTGGFDRTFQGARVDSCERDIPQLFGKPQTVLDTSRGQGRVELAGNALLKIQLAFTVANEVDRGWAAVAFGSHCPGFLPSIAVDS